ncbi:TPA: alpha-2,3-sialyltransferase [Campylobacter jejuni]
MLLRKEINTSCVDNILISSEAFWAMIDSQYSVLNLKKILNFLGFMKVYIIVYLRPPEDVWQSLCSEFLKNWTDNELAFKKYFQNPFLKHILEYKKILSWYLNIFKKENVIIRPFNKEDFVEQNLLYDFLNIINIDKKGFENIDNSNISLDLIGMELLSSLNKFSSFYIYPRYYDLIPFFDKYFTSKNPELKFQPPKEIYQSYIDYFEESNEWVRKEFFPHKERLFPKKDLNNYKENYELREMKPEYWDRIAKFIADIIKTKNENILSLNQTLEIKNQELSNQTNQIHNLNTSLENKQNLLNFQNNYGKAKARIQNQLSYKLGQALILNSKSVLGFLSLPFIILSIVISHKQEQKAYKFKVKKNPNSALPPLETYPDYNEALKEKECFTYKLGEAFIKASKNWYGGGYIKFILKDVPRLKREINQERK